jgi:hypothetical protein
MFIQDQSLSSVELTCGLDDPTFNALMDVKGTNDS